MKAREEILDEMLIREKLEKGEQFNFVKPMYAQGWLIGLIWLIVLPVIMWFWKPEILMNAIWFQGFLIFIALLSLYKFFSSPRMIKIEGDTVSIYTYSSAASAEFQFSKMTLIADTESIYFIKKRSYTGGYTLNRTYWGKAYQDMKKVFTTSASYVKDGTDTHYGMPTATGAIGMSPAAGSASFSPIFSAFIIIYGIILFPYLLLCRTVFGR